MAVTPVGNPYVESSDLVANYPGASEALAERIDIVGVNPFANAAARDAAIPSPVQGQMCSLNDDNKGYRYDGSAWVLFSGAGPANFTNTATGTYSSGGDSFKYVTFTGSGSLVVDRAGFADILVVGGGGSGSRYSAGGAGGHLEFNNAYLALGTLTVTVGAGGAANSIASVRGYNGIASSVGSYFSPGGGGGAVVGINGGSGSGGSTIGLGIVGLGNNGGILSSGNGNTAGGGGGAGAVGGNAVGFGPAGVGGAGRSNSITGTAVTRAGGGGSGGFGFAASGGSGGGGAGSTSDSPAATSGTANTGGGGGGAGYSSSGGTGGAGGSGLVIVRVVV